MQSWQIGKVRVSKIVELEFTGGTDFILPDASEAACLPIDWLQPNFMAPDGQLIMSIHALVIETPERRIVVDTCIGNDKPRSNPAWSHLQKPFLADMAAAGFPVDTIDTVMCTHLHVDHVGWNTMLVDGKWVPTFKNARYLMATDEYNYWRDQDTRPDYRVIFDDSVRPVFEAGLVDFVATEHRICPEVYLTPTLGHTPGHVSVMIESEGERAMITGDFIHHPCQMAHTEWCSSVDYDRVAAKATRDRVFAELADREVLVIGTHFAGVTAGYLKRDGNAYRLAV